MNTFGLAALIALATFSTFYALWAFVSWDIYWMASLAAWSPHDRAGFALFMVVVPAWLSVIAFAFRPLKRS